MNQASDPVLAVAVRAARTAASIVVDAARDLKRLPTFSKEQAGIVSGADMEAEDAIVATIRGAFPDHAILGEESGAIPGARESGGSRWLVDPIDGTANFIHGYPSYAISIAFIQGAEITHAVVLDPVRDELFTATRAKGATGLPVQPVQGSRGQSGSLSRASRPPRSSLSSSAIEPP